MPFEKGNKLAKNQGRKGYAIEAKNLSKMNKLFGKDLDLVEKVYKGKATKAEIEIFKIVQARVLKYSDKLHATKTEIEGEVDFTPVQIIIKKRDDK